MESYSILLTIERCWAIVPDKRAAFLKNTRRFIQILDTSGVRKFIKQAQFLKQLSKISAIHFLSYRVPYGVSRTAFYRKLRHEESSHSFRSQPVVAVFFHQTCSRPRGSDSRQLCPCSQQRHDCRDLSNTNRVLCWLQDVPVMLHIFFQMPLGEFLFRATISHVTGNATIGFFLMLGEREKIEHTNKRKSLASFSLLIII